MKLLRPRDMKLVIFDFGGNLFDEYIDISNSAEEMLQILREY